MLKGDYVSRTGTELGGQIREVSILTGIPISVVNLVVKTYIKVLIVSFVKTGKITIKNLVSGDFREFRQRGAVKTTGYTERAYFTCSDTVKNLRRKHNDGEINGLAPHNFESYHNRFSSQMFTNSVVNGNISEGGMIRAISAETDSRAENLISKYYSSEPRG